MLVNKPSGITSFATLSILKKNLLTKKIGHTGTLDKFANGLMIVLTGRFTAFCEYFTHCDKTYIAQIQFGTETSTLDPEGEVIAQSDYQPSQDEIEQVIQTKFTGAIEQVPPQYSAIHIDGKRAYQYARSGEEVNMPTRSVHIHHFKLLSYNYPLCEVEIKCSSGTYIRSLARDLAINCQARAHLIALKRTQVGEFCLDQALPPNDIFKDNTNTTYEEMFTSINDIETYPMDDEFLHNLSLGKSECLLPLEDKILSPHQNKKACLLLDKNNNGLALLERATHSLKLKYRKNFTPPLENNSKN